jgi:hypothetical protein
MSDKVTFKPDEFCVMYEDNEGDDANQTFSCQQAAEAFARELVADGDTDEAFICRIVKRVVSRVTVEDYSPESPCNAE